VAKTITILGISAYYHDSAATILSDGKIVAAAQEERFTRIKHDAAFPLQAINYCLSEANIALVEIDYIVFYDKPMLKFERLLQSYLDFAPIGLRSFIRSMPIWLKQKLLLKAELKKQLSQLADCPTKFLPPLLFTEHHQSHAASAYYASPFQDSAVLCLDGAGEWATTSAWLGNGHQLKPLWQINFPHSIGLLYSAFTYYCGFKVNSGEYKLMGLAPYGKPKYSQLIYDHLIDVKEDGSFRLNMQFFDYCTGLTMTNKHFDHLFGGSPRDPESAITQRDMDLAASIQQVTEELVIKLCRQLITETGAKNLCLAGGVALNCVANGKLLRSNICDNIWIQPAAGDAGGALGAALAAWHQYLDKPKISHSQKTGKAKTIPADIMSGSYLGPAFSNEHIEQSLTKLGAIFQHYPDNTLFSAVALCLAEQDVVGWFQGRMEFGPRALGARSIIGDPRSDTMQQTMNEKIKFRESFRPFAPSVLAEKVSEYFDLEISSPYMLLVATLNKKHHKANHYDGPPMYGLDRIKLIHTTLPAITHVDHTARVQTVHAETNPRYHQLLKQFERLTGCGVLINTSFNVRGEPIVCTPEDAYRCFMRTNMDTLVLENYILHKKDQPLWNESENWQQTFTLD
jgi:carbamoyltransferase